MINVVLPGARGYINLDLVLGKHIIYVCNRLFSKTGKKCFRSLVMSADDIANMSRHFRKEHASLAQRFKRAGLADVQARSSRAWENVEIRSVCTHECLETIK